MRILVDADACPVREIILREAKRRGIPVIMIIDTSHELHDDYSQVITVDKGRDSADFKLISLLLPTDIVVTQDFGVAAMALGKGARALNQNGMAYTAENMDRLLFERHLGQKIRRGGGRTGNPRKRTPDDDRAFETELIRLLNQ
ncbi:MAG: YaiI/YqxD family protein [Candidatus Merdivicinus sp.]|jgi:uncharacterized protein YaiI (UPF0178 family)